MANGIWFPVFKEERKKEEEERSNLTATWVMTTK
jgi:hypothetical protein